MLKWLRRGATIIGVLLAIPLVLLAIVLGAVQLSPVQAWLAAKVQDLTAGTDNEIRITGLSGSLPFAPRIGRLTVADQKGIWLEIDRARLELAWTELFAARIHVKELGAERVAVLRTPVSTAPEPPPEPFALPDPTSLPSSIPALSVDRLQVDRIELAEPVLGQAAVLTLTGAIAADDQSTIDTRLDLRRVDQPDLSLTLASVVDLAARRLSIDLAGSETGGLVAKLAGLPQAGDLKLGLHGAGPLDAWTGKLTVDLARAVLVEADLKLGITDHASMGIDAVIQPADGLLPKDAAPLVGERPTMAMTATIGPDGSFILERLAMALAAMDLSGSLRVPADDEALSGSIVVNLPDLAPLSQLAAAPLQGSLRATLDLGGSREQPAATLALRGDDLAMDRLRLAGLATDLKLVADSPLGATLDGADFDLETRLAGLDLADAQLSDQGPVTLNAAGSLERDGRVRIEKLAAAGLGATLDGSADLDTASLTGEAALVGKVPALQRLALFLPEPWRELDGQGSLDLKLTTTDTTAGDATSLVDLELTGLSGIPQEFARLIGEQVSLQAHALIDAGRHVSVRDLSARTAALALDGEAQIDLEGGPLQARLEGGMDDLGDLAPLAGLPLSGQADLTVRADGSLAAPNAVLSLKLAELGGLPEDLAALLGTSPSLHAEAAQQEDGTLTLHDLRLQTATAAITGDGRFVPKSGAVEALLEGQADDLAFLGRWLGGEPQGQARLRLAAGGTIEQPVAELSLHAEPLSGLPDRFAGMAGEAVTLDAKASVVPAEKGEGRVARLDSLDLRTGALSLTGDGSFGLEDQALQAKLHAEIADLSKASAAASTELAGSLRLDATASGDLARPGIDLHLEGDGVEAAGRPLGKVTADLKAQDLIEAPEGRLDLAVMAERTPLTLSTGFRKDDALVELDQLQLRGPGALKLDGGLTLDMAGPTARGRLSGGVGDLAGLQPLLGQALAGKLKLDLQADDKAGQSAKATINGSAIAVPGVIDIGALDLEATLRDLLATPTIDATLVAQDVTRQDVDLTRTTLGAKGRLDAVDVTLATKGDAYFPLDLDAATKISRNGEQITVDLTRLAGSLAEKKLRLQKPAKVEIGPKRTALEGLDLRYDEARLTGDASLAGGQAKGALRLRDLQLASLSRFGAPPLTGNVQAEVTLAGTTGKPQIALFAQGRGLGVQGVVGSKSAPLDLDLDARTTGERLNGKLDLSGLGEAPLRLDIDAPMQLALQPFAFDLPMDQPVQGSLDGTLDLARIARFAALDGQRVAGRLLSDLRFSGTLTQPLANGRLQLRDVTFSDLSSGASIRDLALTLRANGQKIRLEELSATDGASGRLSGTGQADLGNPDLPYDIALKLDSFQPVYRDDLLLRLGGTVGVEGNQAGAKVTGRLRVDRAEIAIPNGGSAGSIPVIEIDDGSEPAARGAAAPLPYRIALDVVVDMPERIFVRGRGVESEWGGKVTVAGTASEPDVSGQIAVKRGYVDFLDRRFEITSGTVTLDGAVPPDPEINLEASFEANTLTGILRVTGRASDPKLELTSDPVRPQDEIMAEILFGRDVSSITPVQGLQLAAALNTLRGGGGNSPGLLDMVRSQLGVDTLDVGGDGPDGGTNVKAGKYLSDDVFLQVERGVTPGSGKATVEVEVLPNVTVQTEVTEDSQTGFGVQWKYDY